ncbi:MAG: hypothetical protein QM756_32355 [Polyangiaceae bacterium]
MPPSLSSEHTSDTFRPPANRGADEDVPFESGIPPGGLRARTLAARGEAHAQLALGACARTDANLGSLLRTVQHIAATINSAREARDDVVEELEHLRTLLGQADEEQLSLRHRTNLLEQTLERTERDAARERAFLIDEQDTFIGALWDEHATELGELRRRLTTTEELLGQTQDENQRLADGAHSASLQSEETARRLRKAEADLARVVNENTSLRETLSRLQMEREEALLAASQTTRERDRNPRGARACAQYVQHASARPDTSRGHSAGHALRVAPAEPAGSEGSGRTMGFWPRPKPERAPIRAPVGLGASRRGPPGRAARSPDQQRPTVARRGVFAPAPAAQARSIDPPADRLLAGRRRRAGGLARRAARQFPSPRALNSSTSGP